MTIILTQFFLWQYLGPSSLAGLVIIVVLIPVEAVISRKLKQLNIENLENKDNRIKTMNEILEGIKVIKLSAWEPAFSAKVQSMREKEISTMKRRSLLSALNTFITSATPFFVALSSFATFVLVDPANNILTPEIAFVSLTYFNILRRPLNQLPTLVVTCVQSLVSVRRINTFLQADELSPEVRIVHRLFFVQENQQAPILCIWTNIVQMCNLKTIQALYLSSFLILFNY